MGSRLMGDGHSGLEAGGWHTEVWGWGRMVCCRLGAGVGEPWFGGWGWHTEFWGLGGGWFTTAKDTRKVGEPQGVAGRMACCRWGAEGRVVCCERRGGGRLVSTQVG